MSQQIVYTHHTVDGTTGEVIESKYVKKEVKDHEEFILMYMKHLGTIAKLPGYELRTLVALSQHVDWETGDIGISPNVMEKIQKLSELEISSIRSALSRLTKKNILRKEKNNWYKINPDIFWRGSQLTRQKMFEVTYQWEIKND